MEPVEVGVVELMSLHLSALADLLAGFSAVSLDELDERAALLQRTDRKYMLRWSQFQALASRLRPDHEALEIDGSREFGYRTTYFDTPDIRCFVDHVSGQIPRFKVRTRTYEDSGECTFEVKLKRSEDETDKRQLDYAVKDRERLTEQAWECVHAALHDAGLDVPNALVAGLQTQFRRATLATARGSERLTCDFGITLRGTSGGSVQSQDDLVLVETKSETGESPADRALAEMGIDEISLSKYRVGMSLAGAARGAGPQPGSEFFA